MDKTKNILVLIHGFNNGGVEAVMYSYLSRLDKSLVKIDMVAYEAQSETCLNKFKAIAENIYFVTPKSKGIGKYIKEMKSIMKNNHYDVIHSNLYEWNSIPLKIADKMGIPIRISHTHIVFNNINFIKKIIKFFNSKIIKKHATQLIGCSRYACDYLYGKNNGIVLSNAFDFSRFVYDNGQRDIILKRHNIPSNKFIIGNVGRLHDQKNHRFMIEIASEIKNRGINACFLFVGCGELEDELKSIVLKKELSNYVVFAGETSDTKSYYSSFDMFCFPSLYEGLGLALVEASVSGLYCIASKEVPDEAFVSNRAIKISIEEGANKWVDKIEEIMEKSSNIKRDNLKDFLLPNAYDFDIKNTINKFKQIYGFED